MSYINVGVDAPANKSKKALRDAVKTDPSTVSVYSTSPMGGSFFGPVSDLTDGVKLSAVGPDPYTSRKWYATIERKNGKIVVS